MRGGGMMRHDIEHFLSILHTTASRDRHTEHYFLSVVMEPWIEREGAAALRLIDRPTGEAARYFGDIFLRIAAIHAQRVKLQQLAPVILIQSAATLLGGWPARLRRIGSHRLPIVQDR